MGGVVRQHIRWEVSGEPVWRWWGLRMKPVAEDGGTIGCEDTLWMELDTTDVEVAMAEGHDLAFGTIGGDFEAGGEVMA